MIFELNSLLAMYNIDFNRSLFKWSFAKERLDSYFFFWDIILHQLRNHACSWPSSLLQAVQTLLWPHRRTLLYSEEFLLLGWFTWWVVVDLLVFSVSCFTFQHPTWFWVVQLIFCRSSAAQTRLALISLGLLLFLWSPVSKRGCCDMTLEGRTTGVSKSGPGPTKLVFCNTNKAHHLAEVDCRTLCAKWAW